MNGFSLIELLFVLFIITVFAILVVPSYQMSFNRSQDQVLKQQLLRAIQLTRSTAMIKNQLATLCKSSDGKTCSGQWAQGYIVIVNQQVIYTFDRSVVGSQLNWRAAKKSPDLSFLPNGYTDNENGTFWYCPAGEKNPSWAVVVNKAGRIRTIVPNKQGVILDDKKKVIACA